jgi:hypothetical protein
MGLLKHFRSRSRLQPGPQAATYAPPAAPPAPTRGRDLTQIFPDSVLENIFTCVCPHTLDQTYLPSEQSQIGDGCMLCDLRDLACCARGCRKWYTVAQRLLYTSVRIDAVHYCALEEALGEKRKKAARAFGKKSRVVEPGEVPNIRLGLLCRTVRDNAQLAEQVLVLKLPYMTRETAKGDLARTVSALPNLRYVDLPDGFFGGDASCLALRQELQARCPGIRKMSYRAGSEQALELLAQRHWQSIQVLELSGLRIELETLRIVLASLPVLREVTLSDMEWLDDTVFQPSPGQLPDFPCLQTLKLEATPGITAAGPLSYLEVPQNRGALTSLSLNSTGVTVPELHRILWSATALEHVAIVQTVSKSLALATAQLPPLTSITLKTLHYEITSSEDVHGLQRPAESYYNYLASSLHQNALPALTTLYVRDTTFPELLLLPSIPLPYAHTDAGSSLRSKTSNLSALSAQSSYAGSTNGPTRKSPIHQNQQGFNQTLEVFSKGIDELEWVFTAITPSNQGPNGNGTRHSSASGGRPLSAYSASRGLGPQWAQGGFGGEARKSVVVGNGFGGFLAVPQEEVPRPLTADGGRMAYGEGLGTRIDGVGGTRWGSMASQGTGGGGGKGGVSEWPPSGGGGSGPSSVGRGSVGSGKSNSRLSFFAGLKAPPSVGSREEERQHGRKGSRSDLWR